jgi:hypothetical protein
LVADGVPFPVVSERLGHASIRTTVDVYAHALRGQDDDAARRWHEFQRRGTADNLERKVQWYSEPSVVAGEFAVENFVLGLDLSRNIQMTGINRSLNGH